MSFDLFFCRDTSQSIDFGALKDRANHLELQNVQASDTFFLLEIEDEYTGARVLCELSSEPQDMEELEEIIPGVALPHGYEAIEGIIEIGYFVPQCVLKPFITMLEELFLDSPFRVIDPQCHAFNRAPEMMEIRSDSITSLYIENHKLAIQRVLAGEAYGPEHLTPIDSETAQAWCSYQVNRNQWQLALGDDYFVPNILFFRPKLQPEDLQTWFSFTEGAATVIPQTDYCVYLNPSYPRWFGLKKEPFITVISISDLFTHFSDYISSVEIEDTKQPVIGLKRPKELRKKIETFPGLSFFEFERLPAYGLVDESLMPRGHSA